ncbi:MAG: dihydrofolate reductase [Rhizobiaceae bacterium]
MRITLIAAVAENGIIGRDGGLPWRLSSDLRRFKADTIGKPVIMGRRTFQSIGRALPDRLNIVVTRDRAFRADGVETAYSLPDALTLAHVRGRCMTGADEICVIGGGDLYAQAMPLADRLRVTHVLAEVDGDTRFPAIDPARWRAVSSTENAPGEKDSHATRYVVYDRLHVDSTTAAR